MSTKPVRAFSKAAANGPNLADEGLLLVDTRWEAVAVDEGATWILNDERTGQDGAEVRLTLPGEIRNLLSSMKATDLPAAKVHFRVGSATYSCRVFLLRRPDGTDPQPLLALHIQRDSAVADAVNSLAAEYNLTDREQEALKAIATGLTSKETAERMNISPNTVKSFLRIIMLKMGVGSRAAIVGKLLEYSKGNGGGSSAR